MITLLAVIRSSASEHATTSYRRYVGYNGSPITGINNHGPSARETEEFLRATESLILLESVNRNRHELLIGELSWSEARASDGVDSSFPRKLREGRDRIVRARQETAGAQSEEDRCRPSSHPGYREAGGGG